MEDASPADATTAVALIAPTSVMLLIVRQAPSEQYLIARIMLLSVVSAKAATPCHQIQS
jgi:hypothetical protein